MLGQPLEVESAERLQATGALLGELDVDPAARPLGVAHALDQLGMLGPVDEPDDAVVA